MDMKLKNKASQNPQILKTIKTKVSNHTQTKQKLPNNTLKMQPPPKVILINILQTCTAETRKIP